MQTLVSIIVPVYNTQPYLNECLDSLRNQDYKNIEVIIVNDGSTDNSKKIITDFINKYDLKNFILIDKENGGVCSARNMGLQKATGDWIAFVDSDDWVETSFVSDLINACRKNDFDFFLSGFRVYEMSEKKFEIWTDFSLEYAKMPEGIKELSSLDYVCGRFYKRELIENHSIKFDERIRFCEDNAFNYDYVGIIKAYGCSNKIGYNYRRGHEGTLSKSSVNPHMRKFLSHHMYNFCEKIPQELLAESFYENISLSRIVWNAVSTDVVVNILDGNYNAAKEKMRQPIALLIVDRFRPVNKKDKFILKLWKKPFFIFKLFVKIFYGNVDLIKKFRWLARFLTH